MKLITSLALACTIAIPAFAQGPLAPSGPPAATMKTLDQIEPRTPIDAIHTPGDSRSVFIITKSGSYYLTTNITLGPLSLNGILAVPSDVTIDLNGFSIIGNYGSDDGIANADGSTFNLTVRNGTIRNCGGEGIYFNGTGGQFEDINFRRVGIGINNNSAPGTSVTRCFVRDFSDTGFQLGDDAVVRDSTAIGNYTTNSYAIRCGDGSTCTGCRAEYSTYGILMGNFVTVSGCTVFTTGNGIVVSGNATISGCVVNSCTLDGLTCQGTTARITDCSVIYARNGIAAGDNATVSGCSSALNDLNGITAGLGCAINNCVVRANAAHGIVTGVNATLTACTSTLNFTNGIVVGQGCTIIGCTMNQNGGAGTNGIGLSTDFRATVVNCSADQNQNDGIRVGGDSSVTGSHASFNGRGGVSAGIRATGGGSRIDGNQTRDNNGYGIFTTGFDIVTRNFSGGSVTNYFPATGGLIAPLLTPATATNALANF